jgi:DNA-directed RNA polymerase specialized sigma24 family protein
MSELLEIPEKTVKSRLFTARRILGDILTKRGVSLA